MPLSNNLCFIHRINSEPFQIFEKRNESHQIMQTLRSAAVKNFGRFTERDLILSIVPQLPAIISPQLMPVRSSSPFLGM